MKTAQLIKREETTLYLNESGDLISIVNDKEKLAHLIIGRPTKLLVIEEVVTRFRGLNNKELTAQFWNYMESEKLDSRNYYLIIDK